MFGAKGTFLAVATLFVLAACGSAAGLNAAPGEGGAGGSDAGASGSGGGTTNGSAGDWGTTTVQGTGGWSSTTTTEGTGGWTSSTTTSGGGWDQTVTVGTGGYGGWGSGGYGGFGGSASFCIPGQSIGCTCATGQLGAQVCQPNRTYGPCVCAAVDGGSWEQQQLARLRRGIVGTWLGVQTNPWSDVPCSTKIQFEANGHYSAHSPNESCTVFYYGSNDDSPEKRYSIDDVLANGEGHAEIEIWFSPGLTNRGELRRLFLSEDENELRFEAWKTGYGPLVFTLKRVSR